MRPSERSQSLSIRIPPDVMYELARQCRINRLNYSEVVVASLRKFLGVPLPTEAIKITKKRVA